MDAFRSLSTDSSLQSAGAKDLLWARHMGLLANARAHLGDVDGALRIVRDAEAASSGGALLHPFAAAATYCMTQRTGELVTVHGILIQALSEPEILDDAVCFNATLGMLLGASHLRWEPAWWAEAVAIARKHPELVDDVIGFAVDSFERPLHEPGPQRLSRLQRLERAMRTAPAWHLTTMMIMVRQMPWLAGEFHFVERVFSGFAPSEGIVSMVCSFEAGAARQAGDFRKATAAAKVGINAASSAGLEYTRARLRGHLAITLASLGSVGSVEEIVAETRQWALPRGNRIVLDDMDHAQSLLALSLADFEAAYVVSEGREPDLTRWLSSSYGMAEALDLAECCFHTGRAWEATDRIHEARTVGADLLSPRSRMLLDAAAAVIEPDETVGASLFESALASSAVLDAPFETARVRVAYADFIERTGRDPLMGRSQRQHAVDSFEALGADIWARRARQGLARVSNIDGLSSQEIEVVRLAARGLTNKQIGAELFISPRTVGFHLYNAFPKLGVGARAGLRDALLERGYR